MNTQMSKTFITLSMLLASLPALAVGGDGTRGGAQTIVVAGTERLRDLVDPAICQIKSGEDLRAENPAIDDEIEKIARLDWYFAEGLRWEINHLNFCFTTQLIRLRKNDYDSVIDYRGQGREIFNSAIRFLGSWDVYVDRVAYANLPPIDRTYLPIHEAMHSFISITAPRRIESLMNAVNTLYQVGQGNITTTRKLQTTLARFQVNYPWTAKQLAANRTAIKFALSSMTDKRTMFLSNTVLNSIIDTKLGETLSQTYSAHYGDLTQTPAARVSQLLEEYSEDLELLDRLVNPASDITSIKVFDPLLVALSVSSAQEPGTYLSRILSSKAMASGFQLYNRMKNKNFKIAYSRIYGTQGFQLLGIPGAGQSTLDGGEVTAPALSIIPFSYEAKDQIPAEIQGLVQFLVTQTKLGDAGWNTIEAGVSKNDSFYAAFGIMDLYGKLEVLMAPITREKEAIRKSLPSLVQGLRSYLSATMRAQAYGEPVAREEAARKLDQSIDWARLGLVEGKK